MHNGFFCGPKWMFSSKIANLLTFKICIISCREQLFYLEFTFKRWKEVLYWVILHVIFTHLWLIDRFVLIVNFNAEFNYQICIGWRIFILILSFTCILDIICKVGNRTPNYIWNYTYAFKKVFLMLSTKLWIHPIIVYPRLF